VVSRQPKPNSQPLAADGFLPVLLAIVQPTAVSKSLRELLRKVGNCIISPNFVVAIRWLIFYPAD
jgi:hypothetical protein